MQTNGQIHKEQGEGNSKLLLMQKSRSKKTDSLDKAHISIFDPNKYMLKLPKSKKVSLPNGQVRWEQTEADL